MLTRISPFIQKDTNLKNFTVLLIVVIIFSITAILVSRNLKPPITVPANAQPGDLTLKTCDYKTKSVTYKGECGTIIVPENRFDPTSRLIAVPIKRIQSNSASPLPPIFYLGGGPGMSNMAFKPDDELLAKHDVVLIGYRGVDGSTVLDCPEFSKATLGDGRDIFSDKSMALETEAVKACSARMIADGVDLAGYTIQQVVEDLQTARVGLGYEKINLLSESYGTRIAQIYAYLYPESLNRSVMIGVNPPGRFVWEPAMVDAQIEYYSRLWAKDEKAHARTANLAETMRNVSQNMPKRWLFFPIDAGKVKTVAFVMFFSRNTSAMVLDAFVAAERGDASGLALMSMAYDLVVPKSFVWGDFFAKGASADLDSNRDYATTLRGTNTIIGSPVAYLTWAPLSQVWSQNKIPLELSQVHPSNVETLLVSGSIDFSTPAEYATDELLPSLKNGKQVILSEMGHVSDMWNVQPKATLRLLTSFYDKGKADDSLYKYEPMNFQVLLGFPTIAKILLGTGVLIAFAVVTKLWSVARRMSARKSGKATRQT